MKILINMISLFQGGPKTVAIGYLEGISKFLKKNPDNFQFIIILPEIEEILKKAKTLNLDKDCIVKVVKYPFVKPRFLYKLYYDHIYTTYLGKKYDVDLIFMTANFASLFSLKKQIVLFHNLHYIIDNHPFKTFKTKIKFNLEKFLFKITTKKNPTYLVQLNYIKQLLSEKYRINKEKIFVNYMVPPDDFSCKDYSLAKEKLSRYSGFLKFFLPSKYHPNKNFDIVIEIARYIRKYNLNIKIFLTLKEIEYSNLLENNADLNDVIINLGEIEYKNIRCYYNNMDVLFFPSTSESYGFPLVEALLSDCLILCADTPFSRELLEDYPFYFDITNKEELFNLIKRLCYTIEDKDLKIKKEKVKEKFNFDWEYNIKNLIDIYNK